MTELSFLEYGFLIEDGTVFASKVTPNIAGSADTEPALHVSLNRNLGTDLETARYFS